MRTIITAPALIAAILLATGATNSGAQMEHDMGTKEVKPSKEWAIATFAGGCFWCMEPAFDKIDGVVNTISGYTGGSMESPTYEEVSSGTTGHTESLRVEYDPEKVTYEELLNVFWKNIDPTTENRQFCDAGTQYRPEVFYHNEEQKQLAEASLQKLIDSGRFKKIVVKITKAGPFWAAEDYHQDFYLKNPDHYYRYREGCRRDQRLEQLWGKK